MTNIERDVAASTDPDFIRRQFGYGSPHRTRMADLTVTWFRSAMQPRYQDDGSILRTLTPPRRSHGIPVGLILLTITALSAVAFFYGMLR